MKNNEYSELIRSKADQYAHRVYFLTRKFPKEELYGVTSQLRRASLSVVLNFIEGYARNKPGEKDKTFSYFLDVSYGSLRESKYLLEFSLAEGYLSESEYKDAINIGNEVGAMLWTMLKKLKCR